MRNIMFIIFVVIGIGYMFVLLGDKYDRMKETNNQINKTQQQTNQAKTKE